MKNLMHTIIVAISMHKNQYKILGTLLISVSEGFMKHKKITTADDPTAELICWRA